MMFNLDAEHTAAIAIALAAISEIIGLYPKIRANSITQLVLGAALKLFPKR